MSTDAGIESVGPNQEIDLECQHGQVLQQTQHCEAEKLSQTSTSSTPHDSAPNVLTQVIAEEPQLPEVDKEQKATTPLHTHQLITNRPVPTYTSSIPARTYSEFRKSRTSSYGSFCDFRICPGACLIGIPAVAVIAIVISMIAIGSTYLHDCPKEKYIPIYLIVAGVFLILEPCFPRDTCKCLSILNDVFNFAWFIAGSVWVYRINEPNYDPSSGDEYCNKTLYLFSFWLITCMYMSIIIAVFLSICICLCR